MTNRIEVLLDVNVLARGFGGEVNRAGIFRATEGLTRAMSRRGDVTLRIAAESSWASELLLLGYDRVSGGGLEPLVQRYWQQDDTDDDDALALILRVVEEEAAGRQVRRDRATLTLLNATARRSATGPVDVLHSLRTALPAPDRIPARVRALTIHDLIPLLHPEWMYPTAEAETRAITDNILLGDFVIANSEATAADVAALLTIPRERIFVTPFAADPVCFHPERSAQRIADVMARHHIPGRYLLSVCTLEPRKNLLHLLACFLRLRRQNPSVEATLVLVGATGWKTAGLFDLIERHEELRHHVVLAGYVPDADLAALYSGARAFVYPSLYEGFGLPVLEAMQCGTPVITSDVSSLPEVVGGAAITLPPTDRDALSAALHRVLTEDGVVADLAARGLARSRLFSWERTADATVRAYSAMLAGT